MVLPAVVVAVVAATIVLARHLTRERGEGTLWPAALRVGVTVGVVRAVLAPIGWYVVEHTGGPLQVPAYVLAMLALPEGVLLAGHRGPASVGVLLALALVLLAGSVLAVSAVALIVQLIGGLDVRLSGRRE